MLEELLPVYQPFLIKEIALVHFHQLLFLKNISETDLLLKSLGGRRSFIYHLYYLFPIKAVKCLQKYFGIFHLTCMNPVS